MLPDYIRKYALLNHDPSAPENRKQLREYYAKPSNWQSANPNVTSRELLLDQPKAEMRRPRVKATAA